MRPGARPRRAGGGYTLVEFIIALTLVALIMVMLGGGMFLGIRSWEAVDAKTTRVGDARLALDFVRRQLTRARPVVHQLPAGKAPLFWGTRHMLEWVAPLPPYVGSGGLSVMRLGVEGEPEARRLVLERWFLHPSVTGDAAAGPVRWVPLTRLPQPELEAASTRYGRHLLMEGLQGADFAYFGSRQENAPPAWGDTWAGVAALPRLFRLRLHQPGEHWPELVVALPDPPFRLGDPADATLGSGRP